MEPVVAMYTAEAEEELLGGAPDFVLDAIDNIDTKVGGGAGEGAVCECAPVALIGPRSPRRMRYLRTQ